MLKGKAVTTARQWMVLAFDLLSYKENFCCCRVGEKIKQLLLPAIFCWKGLFSLERWLRSRSKISSQIFLSSLCKILLRGARKNAGVAKATLRIFRLTRSWRLCEIGIKSRSYFWERTNRLLIKSKMSFWRSICDWRIQQNQGFWILRFAQNDIENTFSTAS